MAEKAPHIAPLAAYEAALAEERLLWRPVGDPELKATDRVVAYARWRTAAERVKALALTLDNPEAPD